MMYEEELLKEMKELNRNIAAVKTLLENLLYSKDYGGVNFADCIERIMFGVERHV